MNEVENFELDTILSMTTGINLTNNFDKVWKLVWFVMDNNLIGPMGLGLVKDDIKKHLLTIHPELKGIKYQKGIEVDEFIAPLEKVYGTSLPVTKLGVKLPKETLANTTDSAKHL